MKGVEAEQEVFVLKEKASLSIGQSAEAICTSTPLRRYR